MPLGAYAGGEEKRIPGPQPTSWTPGESKHHATFDHVDGLFGPVEPVESTCGAVPYVAARGAIGAHRDQLVACDRIAFQNPTGRDGRRIQRLLGELQLHCDLCRHSTLRDRRFQCRATARDWAARFPETL